MNEDLKPLTIENPKALKTDFEKDYIKNLYQTEAKKLSTEELSVLEKIIQKAPVLLLYYINKYGINFAIAKFKLSGWWIALSKVVSFGIRKLIVKIATK